MIIQFAEKACWWSKR